MTSPVKELQFGVTSSLSSGYAALICWRLKRVKACTRDDLRRIPRAHRARRSLKMHNSGISSCASPVASLVSRVRASSASVAASLCSRSISVHVDGLIALTLQTQANSMSSARSGTNGDTNSISSSRAQITCRIVDFAAMGFRAILMHGMLLFFFGSSQRASRRGRMTPS